LRRFSQRCSSTITWARLSALWLACALALLAACDGGGPKFKSTDITGADFGKTLELTGHDGKARTLADFRGKVVVLFFGYTHCPDICPTTLADAAAALKSLGKDAGRVQVLFVTVDPERDTPDVLSKYVPAFDSTFLGLYGDVAATQRVAKEFRIFYEKRPGGAPGAYTVDHSAQSYVFDAQGRLRLLVRHDRIAQDLADDLRTLLKS
jgi:protein SCO1/2